MDEDDLFIIEILLHVFRGMRIRITLYILHCQSSETHSGVGKIGKYIIIERKSCVEISPSIDIVR